MVHESLQRDIISEDGLRRHTSAVSSCRVGGRWVQLGQKETSLGATSIANDETGQWETVGNQFLCRLVSVYLDKFDIAWN